MGIGAIRYGLPLCSESIEAQSKCSLVARVFTAAFGSLALLVGILALYEVAGAHALGTTSAASLITAGILTLSASLCLRCVHDSHRRETSREVAEKGYEQGDMRALDSYFSEEISTDSTGKTTVKRKSFCLLEKFLESQNPSDIALRKQLTHELGIEDLSLRKEEIYGNKKIAIALPIMLENGVRDDRLLFEILKLIYMQKEDFLQLSIEEVVLADAEQKNIVSLRLLFLGAIPEGSANANTIGSFLHLKEEILSDSMSPLLYRFFNREQVLLFLENTDKIESKHASALFPTPPDQPFTTIRSCRLLSGLSVEHLNKLIPVLNDRLLWPLVSLEKEIDYNLLTEKQVTSMFSATVTKTAKTKDRISSLSIGTLNKLLPKMDSSRLQLLTDNHLQDPRLDLRALPKDKIRGMFPLHAIEKSNSKRRFAALAPENREYVRGIVNFGNS